MFNSKPSLESLDVDARFLLANERTLLAWIRTGLTLIIGGVAIAFIYIHTITGAVAGIGAILFGACICLIGYWRYREADIAIRRGELPATGRSGLAIILGISLFAVALVGARALGL